MGFKWVPSAKLPDIGRLVVETKDHAFAVIDLAVYDTHINRVLHPRAGYWIKTQCAECDCDGRCNWIGENVS